MEKERIEKITAYCGLQEKHTEGSEFTFPTYIATTMQLAQVRALNDHRGGHDFGFAHKIEIENGEVVKFNEGVMILYSGNITVKEVIKVARSVEDQIARIERTII